MKFCARLLRALKTKIFRKYSSLLSHGKIYSSLIEVSTGCPIFRPGLFWRTFSAIWKYLGPVPFVIGSLDNRPIVKYRLDNWVYRAEFLLLAKEISLFSSVGQVASLLRLFFNVSHTLSQVKQLSNFMPSRLLSATEPCWRLSFLNIFTV